MRVQKRLNISDMVYSLKVFKLHLKIKKRYPRQDIRIPFELDKYADGGTKHNMTSEPVSTNEEVVDIHNRLFEAMEIGERKLLLFLVV